MTVCLKGVPEPVDIASTVPIAIASYPDREDNPVQEHKIHFFVLYQGKWAEISLKSYNKLAAAGNPVGNATDIPKAVIATGFTSTEANGTYYAVGIHNGQPLYLNPNGIYIWWSGPGSGAPINEGIETWIMGPAVSEPHTTLYDRNAADTESPDTHDPNLILIGSGWETATAGLSGGNPVTALA